MRLPGKVLREVMGKPLIRYEIERLKRVKGVQLVIATTGEERDGAIARECADLPVYMGSETDVLARYWECASFFRGDVIIRVTGDCPLIDPVLVEEVIAEYDKGGADYVSNVLVRSYPRGFDVEVFPFEMLDQAYRDAIDPYDREHVTPFIIRESMSKRNVAASKDYSEYQVSVDTLDDFLLVQAILEDLYPKNPYFTWKDVVNWLEENDHL